MDFTREDKFECKDCNSVSFKTPGTCCGGKEREKVCGKCGHIHEGKTCDCGCTPS